MAERLYYSIQEVSDMLQLPKSTLRYWEKEVAQLEPKTVRGRRYYSPDDIALLKRIIFLRDQNVPIKDWSMRLRMDQRVDDKKRAAIDQLKAIREELIVLKNMI